MTEIKNKAFWVFQNMKECVDLLPPRLRGQAWNLIISYAFGDNNCEQSCHNNRVLLTFHALKPLIRLRGIAGSQNGKSNNPSGLSKTTEPNIGANIGANPYITNTDTDNKEKKERKENYAFAGKIIKLNEADFFEWKKKFPDIDLIFELEKIDLWFQEHQEKSARWFFMTQSMLLKSQKKASDEINERRRNPYGRG